MVVFGNVVVFGQNMLYSDKIGCINQIGVIWAKLFGFGQIGFIWAKLVVFGEIGCIWAKLVVFGQN